VSEALLHEDICLAAQLKLQDYHRLLVIRGDRFGDEEGWLEVKDRAGNWVALEVKSWRDDQIVFYMGMRKDGFPSDHQEEDLFLPSRMKKTLYSLGEGVFLLRVKSWAGFGVVEATSDPAPFRIQAQVSPEIPIRIGSRTASHESWRPVACPTCIPAEHQPAQNDWTEGPTIQHSRLRVSGEPLHHRVDDREGLVYHQWYFSDESAAHITSEHARNLGNWHYELSPDFRDLNTSISQEGPEVSYYGFRMGFGNGGLEANLVWDLVYD
jgi:hypothetical protein